jgi:ribosome-associated protein
MDALQVTPKHAIPDGELEWRFDPSGGPGGQHANRSSTRVELRFDLGSSEVFDAATRERMMERLGHHVHNGVVSVVVDESRSQYRNRVDARRRMADLLKESMKRPKTRRRTAPTRAARRRRLEAKRRRSETKRLRRRPDRD